MKNPLAEGSLKFGLVFEEHREAIDETLETHTPALTENKKLFIDTGELGGWFPNALDIHPFSSTSTSERSGFCPAWRWGSRFIPRFMLYLQYDHNANRRHSG